jgi:hypothetical protein
VFAEAAAQAELNFTYFNPDTNQFAITNTGDADLDISDYRVSLGLAPCLQFSNGTGQSTNLSENASLDISVDVDLGADGLGLFTENTFGSSCPTVLLDFVQYGETKQP